MELMSWCICLDHPPPPKNRPQSDNDDPIATTPQMSGGQEPGFGPPHTALSFLDFLRIQYFLQPPPTLGPGGPVYWVEPSLRPRKLLLPPLRPTTGGKPSWRRSVAGVLGGFCQSGRPILKGLCYEESYLGKEPLGLIHPVQRAFAPGRPPSEARRVFVWLMMNCPTLTRSL